MSDHSTSRASAFDTAITFIPLISGSLSLIGSSAMLYNILSDAQRRFTTPYYRIMIGLSISDLTYAITKMFSTFAIPKGTPGYYYASGDVSTCTMQGFFIHLGMIQPGYTASLCLYYLLVIKYGKLDEYISKKVEPWLHLLSVGYPFITAIVSVPLKFFNPGPVGCTLTEYPVKCFTENGEPCSVRGKGAFHYLLLCYSFVFISFCITVWTMCSVVLCVRKRQRIMNRRFSFSQYQASMSDRLIKNSKDVLRQALLYVVAFFFVWVFGSVARIVIQASGKNMRNMSGLLILNQIFNPMLGFFNAFIYFYPRFVTVKEENKNQAFLCILKDTIFTKARIKQQRRSSRLIILEQQQKLERRNRGNLQNNSLGDICPRPMVTKNVVIVPYQSDTGSFSDESTVHSNVHNSSV